MIMQDYNRSENYINRELSWLDFNLRVLHEARDKENPLFERSEFRIFEWSLSLEQ